MVKILKSCNSFILFIFFLCVITFHRINAQEQLLCKVNDKDFEGKIESAVLVNMGSEKFIQVKAVDGDRIMFVYLKTTKLKPANTVTLEYRAIDSVNTTPPDAEIVWAPEGPEKPQWNSVEGKAVINQYDPESKTISGIFDFVVEKFSYSSRANSKRPSAEITNGRFNNIHYIEEEKK